MTSPNLDHSQPITPSDLRSMQDMSEALAAGIITGRAKFIDRNDKMTFAERGCLAEYVDSRRLYEHVDNPSTGKPCASQNEWIEAFCPFSRATWFEAKKRWKELEDVPADDKIQMSRGNLIVMQKLSPDVRKRPEVIEAAKKTRDTNQFIDALNESFPDQHLEPTKRIHIAEKYAADEFEEAVQLAMRIEECGRSEAILSIARDYIDGHRDQYDSMMLEETA